VALAAGVLLAVTGTVLAWRRAQPQLLWGWLWFLGTLLPVIGIVQVGLQSHADRYAYIPSIGILVAVTWLAGSVFPSSRVARYALGASAVAVIAALAVAGSRQVQTWRSSEALWRHALEVTGDNWQAWNGLGDALFESSRPAEAVEAQRRSLRIRPENPFAWNDLGVALGQLGFNADAIDSFEQALRLDPGYADAWYNLGTAHGNLGEHRRAAAALERATTLRPSEPRFWANLAVALSSIGDRRGAAEAMSRLEALDPALAAEMRR
jgi:tetratricopeptide (TPR) repeat protein